MAKSTNKSRTILLAEPDNQPEPKLIMGEVSEGNLNVRLGPSKDSPRINVIPKGSQMRIISRTPDSVWFLIQIKTEIGWVMSQYVRLLDKHEQIPILSANDLYQYQSQFSNQGNFSPTPTSEIYKTPNGFEIAPVSEVLGRLSTASPSNIQDIAAAQTALLVNFYNLGLDQARRSFNWALIAAIVGFLFFVCALLFIVIQDMQNASIISLISGCLVEVISGINFYLYGKSTTQLSDFQSYLDKTQSILLANSICESLSDEQKNLTRAELVMIVARGNKYLDKTQSLS